MSAGIAGMSTEVWRAQSSCPCRRNDPQRHDAVPLHCGIDDARRPGTTIPPRIGHRTSLRPSEGSFSRPAKPQGLPPWLPVAEWPTGETAGVHECCCIEANSAGETANRDFCHEETCAQSPLRSTAMAGQHYLGHVNGRNMGGLEVFFSLPEPLSLCIPCAP